MKETIKALKKDVELIQEKIESKVMEGQNLLQGFKRATMATSPTVSEIEEDYHLTVKEIYILGKAKKAIMKSIKLLEKYEK
jgi:hypothetical protein